MQPRLSLRNVPNDQESLKETPKFIYQESQSAFSLRELTFGGKPSTSQANSLASGHISNPQSNSEIFSSNSPVPFRHIQPPAFLAPGSDFNFSDRSIGSKEESQQWNQSNSSNKAIALSNTSETFIEESPRNTETLEEKMRELNSREAPAPSFESKKTMNEYEGMTMRAYSLQPGENEKNQLKNMKTK